MGKRRDLLDESKIEKYVNQGYGSGEGKEYKPWIEIQDVPSLGRVSRIFGWKTNRIHHFLSDLETRYFYILEWSTKVVDIREQYPLLHRELAIKIADDKGIKYPTEKSTETLIVLTTDFMITVRDGGKLKNIARTIKPSGELEKKRIIEKFEIERCYWLEKGIDWGIITEYEIDRTFALNVEWVHMFYRLDDLEFPDMKYFNELLQVLKYKLGKEDKPVKALIAELDYEYNTEPGTFLKLLKHLIASKQIDIDMYEKIDLNKPVSGFILNQSSVYKESVAK